MDLATANRLFASLAPILVAVTLVSLGRGRFALEASTPTGCSVWIERPTDASPFLAA